MAVRIAQVDPKSPAQKAGLRPGDCIESINGITICDYLDFMYASCQENVEIVLTDRSVTIENEDYMPLGISFDTLLIDAPRSCHNRCVFCFIDQLPKGMRKTCYFKDDDFRLSFLQGNYVSMTNMTDADVDRILRYHLPRINISVHTTNPELRKHMLHNRRAGEVLSYLKRFADGGLCINAQIVLSVKMWRVSRLCRSDCRRIGMDLQNFSRLMRKWRKIRFFRCMHGRKSFCKATVRGWCILVMSFI